jgi:hypothetical protein
MLAIQSASPSTLLCIFVFFVTFVAVPACSSSTESTASTKKSCADLQKCCDKASDPTKTSCNAATAGKNEDLCASSYDAMCGGGGGDGGGAVATDEVSLQCAALCMKVASANCTKNPACQMQCVTEFNAAKAKSCVNEWTAMTRCQTSATFTCDSDGTPTTSGCPSEATAFSECSSK